MALKIGVYVDAENTRLHGGYAMRYDVLREFAARGGDESIRLNVYAAFDHIEAEDNPAYAPRKRRFFSHIRDYGFKVTEKAVRRGRDEFGNEFHRANVELDMACDMLLQSASLDRIVVVTGDGDFARVVRALQNKGCRVEVVGFENVSPELRREADLFVSGFLIPDLLPNPRNRSRGRWCEAGSRVRGVCCNFNPDKRVGNFRVMKTISPGLWVTDTRREESSYESIFFSAGALPSSLDLDRLPSHDLVFEFDLEDPDRPGQHKIARNIDIRFDYSRRPADETLDDVEDEPEDDEASDAGDE